MVDCRSVQDMLAAHVLVKVQLNGDASGSEQVAMQLASELSAGRWKPGEKLPSEVRPFYFVVVKQADE